MLRRIFLSVLVIVVAANVGSADSPGKSDKSGEAGAGAKAARVLMLTQSMTFRHGSVTRKKNELSPAERAITDLGIKTGLFRVDCTQDAAKDFTKERLAGYDIVYFYTTGKLPIEKESLEYFINDWLKQKGHGFIGSHSATDTYNDLPLYYEMIGGTFNGHPWNAGTLVSITVHDTKHPAMPPWGTEFEIKDEIYQFKHFDPSKVRVLMSMNMAKTKQKAPYHVPIAWCKNWGDGRVFYISLGHQEDIWTNEKYMASITGAVKWVLGKDDGDATPNPELSKEQNEKAKADVAAAKKK